MLRLLDDVVGIPPSRFDFGDRMAHCTSNPRLARRIVDVVVVWVVKGSRKERNRVVASCTESSRMDVSIALHGYLASFPDGVQVSRIVKRTEVVGTVKPIVVHALMALLAVLVIHQSTLRNEVSIPGAG